MRNDNLKINVFNSQREHSVDASVLKEFLCRLASRMSVRSGFSVKLVRDAAMRRYNSRFAGKDRSTDVLSFPATRDWSVEQAYAGDILISVDAAQRQCQSSLMEEVQGLAVHGLLHLLGFDHEKDDGEMHRMECRLREEFKLPQ